MLEFVFFSPSIREQFIACLQDNDLTYEVSDFGEELLVMVDEDISDEIEHRLENFYDQLLDANARLVDSEDDSWNAMHRVGIQYHDDKGNIRQLKFEASMVKRLHQCLGAEELQAFIQLVADGIHHPDDTPLCKK